MNSYDLLINDSNYNVKNIIITDENLAYHKNDNYKIKKNAKPIYDNNYICDNCDYTSSRKSNYNRHLRSCLKNKETNKSLKEYKCESCDLMYYHKYNYIRHLQSSKHLNKNSNEIKVEKMNNNYNDNDNGNKYICSICDFECNKKSNYKIHLSCKKHINNVKLQENISEIKTTESNTELDKNTMMVETFKNEVISTLMTQLSSVLEENNKNVLAEQTKMMIEQNKMNQIITEIVNKPSSGNSITNTANITNNNTNNHQFNMNMFLNETCKDAMNMSEFIENLTVTMEDMEMTGTLGFAKGMSRIIMNNLNAIEVHKRPIHCSDAKRETLYVKNNGVWEKDTDDKKHTKELIYKVSSLNLKHLLKWRDLPRNKGYDNPEHKKNDEFTILVMEINKVKIEEIEKVVTIISKNVTIDKNKVRMSGYLN